MRPNAHRHRKLKGGRPFGIIIPPNLPPFFSWFHLIDSPLNVALHLDVIRTVLSEKMKELSIPGFIPFILHKWRSHFIYQCNISAAPQRRSRIIQAVKSSIRTSIHAGVDVKTCTSTAGRGKGSGSNYTVLITPTHIYLNPHRNVQHSSE